MEDNLPCILGDFVGFYGIKMDCLLYNMVPWGCFGMHKTTSSHMEKLFFIICPLKSPVTSCRLQGYNIFPYQIIVMQYRCRIFFCFVKTDVTCNSVIDVISAPRTMTLFATQVFYCFNQQNNQFHWSVLYLFMKSNHIVWAYNKRLIEFLSLHMLSIFSATILSSLKSLSITAKNSYRTNPITYNSSPCLAFWPFLLYDSSMLLQWTKDTF